MTHRQLTPSISSFLLLRPLPLHLIQLSYTSESQSTETTTNMASSSNIRAFTMLVDSISRLDIHDETYVSCLVNTFPQLAPSGCTNTVRLTQPTISLARRIKNGSVDVSVPSTALGILASGLLCEHHQDQAKEFALDPSPRTFRTAVQVMLQAMSAAPAGAAHSMPERSSAPATAAPPRVAV